VRKLREDCRRLLAFPEAARWRRELGEGVRLSVSGRYVILSILYVVRPHLLDSARRTRRLADID